MEHPALAKLALITSKDADLLNIAKEIESTTPDLDADYKVKIDVDYALARKAELVAKQSKAKFEWDTQNWAEATNKRMLHVIGGGSVSVATLIIGIIMSFTGPLILGLVLTALSLFIVETIFHKDIKNVRALRKGRKLKLTRAEQAKLSKSTKTVTFKEIGTAMTVQASPEYFRVVKEQTQSTDFGVSRAGAAVEYVHKLIRSIENSTAWDSTYLDEYNVRLDIDREFAQITECCYDIAKMYNQMGARPYGFESTIKSAQAIWDDQYKTLMIVWESLLTRIKALRLYKSHLADLTRQIEALEIFENSKNLQVDIAQLVARHELNDLATENINELSERIVAVQGAMQELVGAMRTDMAPLMPGAGRVIEA